MDIRKWNHTTKVYEPYSPPPGIKLMTLHMSEKVPCAGCGKRLPYGETYTSRILHTSLGFGWPVCAGCYVEEKK